MIDVLSVGNANVDLIINDNKLSSKNEFLVKPGGSACNFAVGCARLGLKSAFLGFVGNDSFADIILDALKREKVKPLITRVKDHTGFVVAFTKKRFKKFYKFPGANINLAKLKIECKTRHVHLATPPLSLLKRARGSISLDPGATIAGYSLDELKPYLKRVKILFPNEEEARAIPGKGYKNASKELIDAGVEVVVIKRGRYGAYLATKEESFTVNNLNYPVMDTTGAGDAFASAFISAWLKGKSLKEACNWAIISSNICVTRIGAQNSATLKEINSFKNFNCC